MNRTIRVAHSPDSDDAFMFYALATGKIDTGEIEFVGTDVRGVAVHAAARVMSLAGPNEVAVSSTTKDLLEGSGLILEDAGSHELKGLSGGRRIFRVVIHST